MFHFYLALAFVYVLLRLIAPLPLAIAWRCLLAALMLVVSQYHLIQIALFGTMFSPEMPRPAVLAASWAFCTFVLLVALQLLVDLGRRLLCLLRQRRPSRVPPLALAVLAAGLAAVGVHQAVQVPSVREVQIPIAHLPADMDGLRVVQLSDLHISRLFPAAWVQAVVTRSNALQADLVLITGDLIDGSLAARREDVRPLAQLRARLGVIAIAGNHEYYFDEPQWRGEFTRLGMQVLINRHVLLGDRQRPLVIAGVSDEAASAFGQPGPDLAAALHGAPAQAPVILLKHRPAAAEASARAGVALQLSGHTHGGMIRGLDQLVRLGNDGFVCGLSTVGDMHLYTSNGTGLWNGFAIRLGVPAEITLITLRRAAGL